jgi:uncharacterized protein
MDKTMEIAVQSTVDIETANASKYLQQLCKHFAHKTNVTFDDKLGEIAFTMGDCHLKAHDGILSITVTVPNEAQLAQLQDVVVRHLVRFAFRETLRIDWRAA